MIVKLLKVGGNKAINFLLNVNKAGLILPERGVVMVATSFPHSGKRPLNLN